MKCKVLEGNLTVHARQSHTGGLRKRKKAFVLFLKKVFVVKLYEGKQNKERKDERCMAGERWDTGGSGAISSPICQSPLGRQSTRGEWDHRV